MIQASLLNIGVAGSSYGNESNRPIIVRKSLFGVWVGAQINVSSRWSQATTGIADSLVTFRQVIWNK